MKVTIIGANSFLGKSIASGWKGKHELTLLTRDQYYFPQKPFDHSFDWNQIAKSDAIIHCVAAGVQRGHTFSKGELFSINCFEPMALVHSLESLQYGGQLITFGSYFSLGGVSEAVTEDDFFVHGNPLNNDYSLSKYLLSSFVKRKDSSILHTHLILSNLYGPLENPERLFPYINKCISQGEKLTFTSGDQIRQFTFVDDVMEALERVLSVKKEGVFHFTNPELMSVRDAIMEAVSTFSTHYQREPEYRFGERKNEDTAMNKLAIEPARFLETFGSIDFTPIKDALSSYLQ